MPSLAAPALAALLLRSGTGAAAPTALLRTGAQGQEKLAQSEVFLLLSRPANLAPFKDAIFFPPLKKIP